MVDSNDAITADQQAARAVYHGSLAPNLGHLMQDLLGVFAAGNETAIRAAVRTFATRLFQGDPVPLRDLADHTPLNYVSLFTGRV